MDEKEVFALQVLKLAESEVSDSESIDEARGRIRKLVERFEERSLSDLYEQINSM